MNSHAVELYDKVPPRDHSNKISTAVLSNGADRFLVFYKTKFFFLLLFFFLAERAKVKGKNSMFTDFSLFLDSTLKNVSLLE